MAKIVDEQNKKDQNYIKMSDNFENSVDFPQLVIWFSKEECNHQVIQSLYYTKKIGEKNLN